MTHKEQLKRFQQELKSIATQQEKQNIRLRFIAESLLEKTQSEFMEEFAKATATFTDEEPPFEADPVKKSRIKIVTRMKSSGKFPGQYFSAMLAGTGGTPISVLGFGEYAQFQPGDTLKRRLLQTEAHTSI